MNLTDAIIIGAGPAGLAMSRALSLRSITHLVVERGRIGERWRSERWNSLRLLSVASQSALPGLPHDGLDPESFMPAADFARYLDNYARKFAVPIVEMSGITAVEKTENGYRVASANTAWHARSVIIATGACDVPHRPACAALLPSSIQQIAPTEYRSAGELPLGGVLVVGASSTGLQIAEEVRCSGRLVTLAVSDHTRMVRRYRGRDTLAWAGDAGILDDPANEDANLEAARRQPSLQLVGREDHRNLDLSIMRRLGIRLAGRLLAVEGNIIHFDGELAARAQKSHMRLMRVLQRIDRYIDDHGIVAPPPNAHDLESFDLPQGPAKIDLERENICSVVWATGYRRDYSWLKVPVLDESGEVMHRGGVTASPGLYIIGLTFLRRRRSNFIDGCGVDAEEIADLVQTFHADSSPTNEAREDLTGFAISDRQLPAYQRAENMF
jgi:putative flavoprotein involved in K+ transport